MDPTETIVRVCCLGPEGVDVPIYVEPFEAPSRCGWIVITRVSAGWGPRRDAWVTYFLDCGARVIDFAQGDDIEEAIGLAQAVAPSTSLRWIACERRLAPSGDFETAMLQGIRDAGV